MATNAEIQQQIDNLTQLLSELRMAKAACEKLGGKQEAANMQRRIDNATSLLAVLRGKLPGR